MWERIGSINGIYTLYRRTTLHEGATLYTYRCDKDRPKDDEYGGYFLASTALRQKGL